MSKLLAALLLCSSLACRAIAVDADPHFSNTDQVRELLAEGVKEYRAGRPKEAALRFRDALKLDAQNKDAYEFYLAVGNRELEQMREQDVLEDVMSDILRRARYYEAGLRRSDKYLTIMIDKLGKTEEERLVATNELVAIGPIAVPLLVARLNDNRQDDMRVYCHIVLSKMGYRAVVPLCEALNAKDERIVESVGAVLGDIGDARALPKLKQLNENADSTDVIRTVCKNAIAAIAHRSNMVKPPAPKAKVDPKDKAKDKAKKDKAKDKDAGKKDDQDKEQIVAAEPTESDLPADRLYFLNATRYFRGGDLVRDEMVANESLMWHWNEDEQDAAKKLSYVRVPRYAWNELMAEELLFDGAGYYNAFTAYFPLLAADLAAQDVEAARRGRLAKERTTPIENPDEAMDAIAERIAALSEIHLRVAMFGPEHLSRAVQQSIVSERYDVAVGIMRIMQDRWLTNGESILPTKEEGLTSDKAGTVLIAALDHGQKPVRYQAAMTLAHIDPSLQFFGAEKVVPLLSEAVGEWGMRVVVVVDQDFRHRNTARNQLQQQGYMVVTANNGFDLMQQLEETPIKDAIIIAGDLLPDLHDQYGITIDVPEQQAATLVPRLKKDWRAEKTPIFISLPEDAELAAKIMKAFEGKVAGFVHKPFSGVEMEGLVEEALKKGQVPNVNREEAEDISLRSALALGMPDPLRTQFEITKAAEALIGTIDARADNLRIQALHSLGRIAQSPNGAAVKAMINKVTDVYGAQDASLPAPVRAAFLYAIGQLDPNTEASIEILLKALQHEDVQVHSAAAEAISHADKIANELIYRYQKLQRLDVRAPGAGKEKAANQ
jgi:HEAT repeat protein